MTSFIGEFIALFCGILLGIGTALLITRRARRLAREARAKLQEIARCKSGPLWVISDIDFDRVTLASSSFHPAVSVASSQTGVLANAQSALNASVPKGTPVFLPVEDLMEDDRWKLVDDGKSPLVTLRTSDLKVGGRRLRFLQYAFDPQLLGREMNFRIRFIRDGVRYSHLYSTYHGERELKRLDPPVAAGCPKYELEEDLEFQVS